MALRIKGELLLADGGSDAAANAEEQFLKALDWARRQDALSWELRVATSLARSWRGQHRIIEAHQLLDGVYRKFTEGFGTADLLAARDLLGQLA